MLEPFFPFNSLLCDQFKQSIGEVDATPERLRPLAERYVEMRTVRIGSPLGASLLAWLVLHAVVVYRVFGGARIEPSAIGQPARMAKGESESD
jgi:hypothetical protein